MMTSEIIIYWGQTNTQIPPRKQECCWGTTNLHANNNVNIPDMMGELPSSREDEGILEDTDAATEAAAVGVQAEETQPLSQPSAKKGELQVPIGMEEHIASTVVKKATGRTWAPSCLRSNSHSSK